MEKHLQGNLTKNKIFVNISSTTILTKALQVGQANHGYYKVLPRLGILEKPVVINGWRFTPRNQDDTYIPRIADRQVMALRNAGIVIKQEIVGHDLQQEAEKQQRIERHKQRIQKGAEYLRGIAAIGSILAVGFVQVLVAAISLLLTVDPALIVVLECGTWLAVSEWEE